MIYELLKDVIENPNPNPYMDKNTIELQVEFFYTANKISETEYNELKLLLNPVEIVLE